MTCHVVQPQGRNEWIQFGGMNGLNLENHFSGEDEKKTICTGMVAFCGIMQQYVRVDSERLGREARNKYGFSNVFQQ